MILPINQYNFALFRYPTANHISYMFHIIRWTTAMPNQMAISIEQFYIAPRPLMTFTPDLSIARRMIVGIRDLLLLIIAQNTSENASPPD